MSVETIETAIQKVLESDDVKAAVDSYEIVYGRDSTDDAAVWVYVTRTEGATDWTVVHGVNSLERIPPT